MKLRRLRELRESRRLSQQALADLLYTTQQNIHKYETGQTEPDLDMIMAMASLFHVSLDYLLSYDPSEFEYYRNLLTEDNSDYVIDVPSEDSDSVTEDNDSGTEGDESTSEGGASTSEADLPAIKADELHLLVSYNQCREPIQANILSIIGELAKAGILTEKEQ